MSPPADTPDPPDRGGLGPEFDFVIKLCHVVASNTELRPILEWIVRETTGLLSADEGSIRLSGPSTGSSPGVTLIRKELPGLNSGSWERPVAANIMGYIEARDEALATPDLLDDDRFPTLRHTQSRVRAVLAMPLRVDNHITGMLAVTNRTPGRRWTPAEIQLLEVVATHSAGVIEKARLRDETEKMEALKQAMERELEFARVRQMSLVPSAALSCGPWEVHGRVVPASQVGGDYYDFFPLDERRFAITIADVSGKGMPAAILMANVQGLLRAFCDGEREITEIIRQVNRGVSRAASDGKFITLFYGEVDHGRGLLRYTNAGHNPPLLRRRDGSVEELTQGGLILGLFDDATYGRGETRFAPGDALLLYSDGITEASDSRDGMYGEDRLRSLWQACATLPSCEVIGRLLKDVETFRGSAGQGDDMTAVVVGPRAGE